MSGGAAPAATASRTSFPDRLDSHAWRIIGVVVLAPFMTQMDSTIVNVSLSSIQADLHAAISMTQWIISGYLLALALMLPLNGWLVDRVGTKKLYVACFSAFTLASLLCGSARTMPQLILARIIQGIAGGLLAPLTQLMMARVAGRQMARVMGYAAAPILLAPLVGPIVAGAILKHASWSWLFFVNVPVGTVAVFLAALVIPRDDAHIRRRPFDLFGFATLSPGLASLLYGLEQASHHEGYWGLVVGVALIGTFIWHARRERTEALIDLQLLGIKTFSVATTTQFLSNGILYAGQFLLPLYLITGCGLTPTQAGWLLAPVGLGMLCVYPFAGQLTERWGYRATASGGAVLSCIGTAAFLWMARVGFSAPLSVIGLLLRGMGQGATGIPALAAAYVSVPRDRLSAAATTSNIVQRLGGPIATTALAIVVSLSGHFPDPRPQEFFVPFVVLVSLQLFLFASAIRLPIQLQPTADVA